MTFPGDAPTDASPGKISYERGFTMIAKHNVKVNGLWYFAGQEIPEEPRQTAKPAKKPVEAPAAEPTEAPKTEEPGEAKAETKSRSSNRAKANK